jgi:FKBP-type peptidyl-prolyl cis-trans isomerase
MKSNQYFNHLTMLSKPVLFISLIIFTAALVISCNQGRQKTNFGLEYEHHLKNSGKTPQQGDNISLNFKLFAKTLDPTGKEKDTLLRSTYTSMPINLTYDTASLDPIVKGMRMVSEGDSITFYMNADSLFKGQRPFFINAGSEARIVAKILKILSNDEYVKEQQKKMEEMQRDDNFSYTHFVKNEGRKPQNGDVVSMHLLMYAKSNGRDTLIRSTYKEGMPFATQYNTSAIDSINKTLAKVSPNDSIAFDISADVLFQGQMPPFIDAKSRVKLIAKIVKIQSKDEYQADAQKEADKQQKEMEKKTEAQKSIDDQIIRDYVKKNNLKATKTASGLYYVITSAGSGSKPKQGEQVAVHYKGSLLSGQVFDSSEGKDPLSFAFNTGAMIKGFDEGVGLLGKGGKATLILPSHLAYGAQGAGGSIPPFSVLRFDIELVEIKSANQ